MLGAVRLVSAQSVERTPLLLQSWSDLELGSATRCASSEGHHSSRADHAP